MSRYSEKRAWVTLRGELILIDHSCLLPNGMWGACPPHVVLSAHITNEELGGRLVAVLQATRYLKEFDRSIPDYETTVPGLLGCKNYREFLKGALFCGVSLEGNALRFYPSVNQGPRMGFVFKPLSETVTLPFPSDFELIGRTLREVLASRCE